MSAKSTTKKLFQVMNSKPDRNRGSLPLDDKRLKFDKKSSTFYTKDPGFAREIEQRYGMKGDAERGRAMVVEVPQSMTKVNEGTRHNHNYFFAVPDLSKIKGSKQSDDQKGASDGIVNDRKPDDKR